MGGLVVMVVVVGGNMTVITKISKNGGVDSCAR